MENQNRKGWLYLLPAALFLGAFLVYPLIDVLIYSFEENFNFASQEGSGVGLYNFSYVCCQWPQEQAWEWILQPHSRL